MTLHQTAAAQLTRLLSALADGKDVPADVREEIRRTIGQLLTLDENNQVKIKHA